MSAGSMKLLWSSRSPFVRKVMVAAHEAGLADRIRDRARGGGRQQAQRGRHGAEPAQQDPDAGARRRHRALRLARHLRISRYPARRAEALSVRQGCALVRAAAPGPRRRADGGHRAAAGRAEPARRRHKARAIWRRTGSRSHRPSTGSRRKGSVRQSRPTSARSLSVARWAISISALPQTIGGPAVPSWRRGTPTSLAALRCAPPSTLTSIEANWPARGQAHGQCPAAADPRRLPSPRRRHRRHRHQRRLPRRDAWKCCATSARTRRARS